MRLRVWLAAWAAAAASVALSAAAGAARTRPVLLLPGFASSQLEAWSHSRCETGFRKNLYRDVNIGDRLWIDIGRVLAQSDCWIRCMKLDIATQDETACKLRAVDGVNGISELDPGLVTGPLSNVWRTLIKDLVQHFHLEPDQLVVAAYDWRLPAAKLQERDRYFFRLMKQIEYTVELNGGEALVVIAHSMGNNMLRYFLAWLKLEIGVNHWQEWIDKHIAAYFAVGAPLLGSTEALELLATGVTNGLPVTQSAIRELVISFGAIISFMPIPSGQPSAADDQVLFSMRYHDRLHAHGDSVERVVNYTSADIASGQFFRDLAAKDPLFGDLEIARRRFYAEDRVLDHFSAWERPPIANVYSVYGVNVPAAGKYDYQRTAGVEEWTMLEREYEDGDDAPELCGKTGDGTVPYHSLSWAHTWLGKAGTKVGVTQTPQSVYFSADDIREVSAVRTAVSHHAQYAQALNGKSLCLADESVYRESGSSSSGGFFNGLFGSSTEDQITFYESTEEVSSGVRTTSVWEVDGARHREILSSPSFLRELRMELRHIFNGKTSADKTSRPPMIDTDCYWNYRQARCEFSEFCEYRYTFGDVTLDQSCRLRPSKQPPAPIHSGELVTPESSSSRTSDKMELKDNAPMSSSRPYCTGSACSSCAAYNECTPLHAMT